MTDQELEALKALECVDVVDGEIMFQGKVLPVIECKTQGTVIPVCFDDVTPGADGWDYAPGFVHYLRPAEAARVLASGEAAVVFGKIESVHVTDTDGDAFTAMVPAAEALS